MHDTAVEQYYELLETYSDKYYNYTGATKKKWIANINLKSCILKDMIMVCSQKMKKNRLIKINLTCHH